jgi:hypothetical protein
MPRSGRLVSASVAVLVLAGAGGAYAYVQATGTGRGEVAGVMLEGVELSAVAPDEVAPGAAGIPVEISYTNWNDFPVQAGGGIALAVDEGPGADWPASCDADDFKVSPVDGPVELAAATTSMTVLPAHTGGVLTWHDDDATDQTQCLNDLQEIGGVPLTLTIPPAV